MNPESAKQFLMDLGLDRSQPHDRLRAFLEWQRQATPEELAALDQWHREWLVQQKEKLDGDAGMGDRGQDWLEQRVRAEQHRDHSPVKYLLRWAAAAVVIGVIMTVAYFSAYRHPSNVRTAIPREGLAAGAVLSLSDGKKVSLESIPVGATVSDGGPRIVKLDSVTVSYAHQAIREKGGYNSLTTAQGKEYRVVLPDGSQVWLNNATTLTYPDAFGSERRRELVPWPPRCL